MNTKNKLNKSKTDVFEKVKEIISNADALVIGAGAGLSASAGLNYADKDFFAEYYSHFLKRGYKTIGEGISANWYLNENTAETYWGFFANHVNNVFNNQPQLPTYKKLYDLIKDKPNFIITTNADGQFFKGNFADDKIFAMQGSYSKFQCQNKCVETLWDNKEHIKQMLDGFDKESLKIRSKDVPRCKDCGGLLSLNLRIDSNFVEGRNMVNKNKYIDFINSNIDKKIVFLELGVGFNTPVIIRFPFEQMTESIKNARLIRVNKYYPGIPDSVGERGISLNMDIDDLLNVI